MKNKFFICLLMVFVSYNSFGQNASAYTEGVTKLVTWFVDIDSVLVRISDKEKLRRIYRQLGYVSEDIDNIAFNKQLLVDDIVKLSYLDNKDNYERLKPMVEEIKGDIDTLVRRLNDIKYDVSRTDQISVGRIINSIARGMQQKSLYLDDLSDILMVRDGKLSIARIKADAVQAKKIADKAEIEIKYVKLKIKVLLR